jgi:peroxiredoxin
LGSRDKQPAENEYVLSDYRTKLIKYISLKGQVMKKAILTMPLTLMVLIALVSGGKESLAKEPTAGKKAPPFILKNYDGNTISLSAYEGKIVVLEWLNYECPFVGYHYEKAKTMTGLADKYKNKNVVWLAINSTKHLTTDKNKEFAEKYNVSYPILDDRSGKVGHAYGAKTTPHMFIIDANGIIVYNGAIDDSPLGRKGKDAINYVDKALTELIGGKEISIPNTKPYGCSVKYAE